MLKLWRLPPKKKKQKEKWSASSFWPTYIGEKGRTLGKTYGIKARLLLGTPLGHTLGIHWELDGNMLGTKEK
jgi:hypothetical protein